MLKKAKQLIDKVTGKSKKENDSFQKDLKVITQLKSYKKHWEPRWYLAMAFYEGVHFTYPKKDQNGNWQRRNEVGKNKIIREIPKAKKQLKAVRNLILKPKQKPVVYPDMQVIGMLKDKNKIEAETKKASLQAKYIDHLLSEVLKLGRFKKKLIKYAELYSCGFIQVLNDNGKKEFAVYNPFEVSVFPIISNVNEYPALVKHVAQSFEDLEGNDLYDQEVIKKLKDSVKDGKYSSSLYYDSYMTERYGNAPDDNVVVDELYQMVKVDIDEDDEIIDDKDRYLKENGGKVDEEGNEVEVTIKTEKRVRIRSYLGTDKIRDDMTRLSKIPISIFVWEDEAYETSLMEDMMPLNKSYDIFMSKLEHKVKKLDTGRILIQKGEQAKVITTNDGEFIRYKRVKPEMMQEATVTNAFNQAIERTENDMKELGVALTSSGGLPQGVEAWRAIESIKEIDYESIGTQQDNLNDCLTDMVEKLVEMIAYDMTDLETVILKEDNGEEKAYQVIGKRGAEILSENEELADDIIVVDPNRTVKVEIESEITWTEQGKRGMTMDLVGKGILPKELALETLKYGNARDIVQKLIQEETLGKSIIDSPEFNLLPRELKQAILQFLSQGAGSEPIPGGQEPPQ